MFGETGLLIAILIVALLILALIFRDLFEMIFGLLVFALFIFIVICVPFLVCGYGFFWIMSHFGVI